jgi:hypothetical protein
MARSLEYCEHLQVGVAGVLDVMPEILFDVACDQGAYR